MDFVTGSKRYCQISSLAKVKVSRSNRKGRARWSGDGPVSTSLTCILHRRTKGTMYGVPALAGKVLSVEGRSKHLEIRDETASDRLKPGLHAPQQAHVRYRTLYSLVHL